MKLGTDFRISSREISPRLYFPKLSRQLLVLPTPMVGGSGPPMLMPPIVPPPERCAVEGV
ncbi:hypothetical protein D3C83_111640 [compost metagenome]